MRFVKVDRSDEGFFLDPVPYREWLAECGGQLPPGASAFATDRGHYDFTATTCVKDLRLSTVLVQDAADRISVEVRFAPNDFKHDSGLRIRYENVTGLSMDVTAEGPGEFPWPDVKRLGDLQLDEILPHDQGISHEIAMTGGRIWIVASDLHAEWGDLESPPTA
ncbi:hypothetical protein [Actinoplanes rectilineatus]|uniref:hypothetical protein n=1 Tax=Actinoplanes rectilineatus TaxID=113571 RepID=UPI0005F29E5D|nr:hypothetical protein [Actinoplanes rectilineatus]